jgi:hypothetical protein
MNPVNSTIIYWDDGHFDHLPNGEYEYVDSWTWAHTFALVVGTIFVGIVFFCFLIIAFSYLCIKIWRCRMTSGGQIYRRSVQNQNNNNNNRECDPNSSMLLLVLL